MATGADNIRGQLRVDEFLTNYATKYIPDERTYIADAASTSIPTRNSSGYFATFERAFWLRDEMQPRALGGVPNYTDYGVGRKQFIIEEYALGHKIDIRQKANVLAPSSVAPYGNLELNGVQLLTTKALLRRNKLWANTVANSTWGQAFTGVASGPNASQFIQWSAAGSNPIMDIDLWAQNMMQVTGLWPNTLVLGVDTYRKLKQNQFVLDLIRYTQRGVLTQELLAELFNVERVLVATGTENTAPELATEDQAPNYQFLFPRTGAWLGHVAREPGTQSPTAVASFRWAGLMELLGGSGNSDSGVVIRRGWNDEATSDYIHCHDAIVFNQIAAELGVKITDAVSAG